MLDKSRKVQNQYIQQGKYKENACKHMLLQHPRQNFELSSP